MYGCESATIQRDAERLEMPKMLSNAYDVNINKQNWTAVRAAFKFGRRVHFALVSLCVVS